MLQTVLAFMLLGVGAIWFAAAWELASGAAGYGGAFPLGLSALLVVLSLLLLITSWRARDTRMTAPPPAMKTVAKAQSRGGPAAAVGLVAMLAGYAIFFDFLGFVTATLLFGVAYLRLLHCASWKGSLGISALVALSGYLVFRVLLDVPLSAGLLGRVISG